MFISNNHASFHLWWKESLLKNQRVSKYYENYRSSFSFLQNFAIMVLVNDISSLVIKMLAISFSFETICLRKNADVGKECEVTFIFNLLS